MSQPTLEEQKEEFLAHFGTPGMKWGHRKSGVSSSSPSKPSSGRPAQSGPKKGFFNNPSAAKAIVLGSYGKKSAYTNPAALAKRKAAGKLRIASMIASAAGNVTMKAATKTQNGGLLAVGAMLGAGAGVAGIASIVTGAEGASMERNSRKNG